MKKFVSAIIVLAMVLAMLPMAAMAGDGTTLYLEPDENWLSDGARFAAYYFEGSEYGWVDCVDTNNDGMYECVIPEGYTNVIFCRMNPATTENNWDNKWNQTVDLTIGEGNLFTIENPWDEAYGWNATGSWGEYVYIETDEVILVSETTITMTEAYDSYIYEVTPAYSGFLCITINGDPGWRVMDYEEFDLAYGFDESYLIYTVYAGVTYQFAMGCFDELEDDYAPGEFTFSVLLAVMDIEPGFGDEDEEVPIEQTIYMSANDFQFVTLPVGGVVNVVVDATENDTLISFDGGYDWDHYTSYSDWYISNGMQAFLPDMMANYNTVLMAGETYTYTIYASESATTSQSLYVTTEASVVGTMNNPDQLVMGENVGSFESFSAYYFGYVAEEEGELTISAIASKSPAWSFFVIVEDTDGNIFYYDTRYSDSEDQISSEVVPVEVGDVVYVAVMDPDFEAGTVYINASFIACEVGGDNDGEGDGSDDIVIGGGDISVTDVTSKPDTPWTYTFVADGPGSLHVLIGDCNPGWRYKIEYPDGSSSIYFSASAWSVGPDAVHHLTAAGTYKVMIWAYDAAAWDNVDGTISATITFTPDSGDVEIPKDDYAISDTMLGLGENALSMVDTAITTIFEFCPDETGIYKFTVGDSTALVGYWGAGAFFVQDMTENKTNSVEQKLNAVGQSIMVGVSGIEGDFTMEIVKLGDVEDQVQIEYAPYANVHTPADKYLVDIGDDDVLNNVDITKKFNVVKDSNGFYHLGSVNGPLLYVNLITESFDLTNAYYSGYGALAMRGKYTDAAGVTHYYDFLEAMRAYAAVLYNSDYENGLYPLTEDLMLYIKAYGAYQGWYEPNTSPFEAIQGDHNADSAWLVSCYYFGDEYIPDSDDSDVQNPSSGDQSIAGLVVAMMAATAGAVVLSKKKEF